MTFDIRTCDQAALSATLERMIKDMNAENEADIHELYETGAFEVETRKLED